MEELTKNWLGAAIKLTRLRAQMSAAQVSELAGYSSSYVAKIESGKLDPSVVAFAKIAKVLNMSDSEIVWLIRLIGLRETE